MKGRTEILPEQLKNYSSIVITFPNRLRMYIVPRTKKLVFENGRILENVDLKIISCKVGNILIIEINAEEKFESDFSVFRIHVRK